MHDFLSTANETVRLTLVFEARYGYSGLSRVLHVAVHLEVAACENFESFVDAAGSNERIGRCDCWDDVFNNSHCEAVVDALDAVGYRSLFRLGTHPLHVLDGVAVQLAVWEV